MAQSETNNFQRAWQTTAEAWNAQTLIALAESPPELDGQPPGEVSLKLSGSAVGVQLQGPPSEVRKDFADLPDKEFMNGQAVLTFQSDKPRKLTVSGNFATHTINVSLSPGTADLAAAAFDALQEKFPRSEGPSESEAERQAIRARKLVSQGEAFIANLKEIDALLSDARATVAELTDLKSQGHQSVGGIREYKAEVEEAKGKITAARDDGSARLEEIKAALNEIQATRKETEESKNNVGALEADIKKFHSDIEKAKKDIADLKASTEASLKENSDATGQVVAENERLTAEIREQLLRATGGRLFGAFEERKSQVVTTKWVWAVLTLFAILVQAAAVVWLAGEAKAIAGGESPFYLRPMFILKATVTIPIIALIVFCIRQYAHEREHEELYAFKSALSFSLAPYLDLVENLDRDREGEQNREKHLDFVIKTILEIFSRPDTGGIRTRPFRRRDGTLVKEIIEAVRDLVQASRG